MDLPAADKHLSRCDAVMQRLVKAHGPCGLTADPATPFAALVRAITHQQLHGKAATTILGRLCAAYPRKRLPTPAELMALPIESLRAHGYSGAKAVALHDLAEKALAGVVPSARTLAALSDAAIIERLTVVRGVGRWTVEMMLMFRLDRPDVWPTDDFGVRNGYRIAYGLAAGVSMGLTDNIDLDVGYRFRDIMISGSDPQEHVVSAGVRFNF